MFEKGVHVTAEICIIQLHLKNGKTVTEESKEMKLDRRTVKKIFQNNNRKQRR